MPIRAVLVDDEELARRRMRTLLRAHGDLVVVGEAAHGAEALELVEALKPDLLFLDIQMPGISGLDVARTLSEQSDSPVIVFVTAFEEHALAAFRLGVVQYLVKPIEREEFDRTMTRVRQLLNVTERDPSHAALKGLLDQLQPKQDARRLIAVRSGDHTILIRIGEVDWIEASGNYVRVHAGAHVYTIRETLGRVLETLDPMRFARIHRSSIVNMERVAELHADSHGDYIVILRDGTRLTLSRSYREGLPLLLGNL